MKSSTLESTTRTLGARIRKARLEQGLTQEKLAGPEFTKGYVSALERGAVRPSLKALEVFSNRLSIPISDFLAARHAVSVEPDLSAIEEDLRYQATYAKMLIRTDRVEEAFELMAEAEQNAAPYLEKLSADVRYLVPFVRGRAYVQRSQPSLARPELEAALELAKTDEEATVRVRNLLGVVFFEQGQPQLALNEHLQCMEAIRRGTIKDLSLQLSVYRNLAGNYWALRDTSQAIGILKEALSVLEDMNDLERQAGVFWGLALVYKEAGDWSHAKLYATRALHIYEAADNRGEAASMCIDMAEILIEERRFEEAKQLLDRGEAALVGVDHKGLWSMLYQYRADLALNKGELEQAAEHAAEGVKYGAALRQSLEASSHENHEGARGSQSASGNQPWVEPIRNYAQALEMAARIEEARGHTEAADRLFEQALEEIEQTSFEETKYAINFHYGEILEKRGAYEQAMRYYRSAARAQPRSIR